MGAVNTNRAVGAVVTLLCAAGLVLTAGRHPSPPLARADTLDAATAPTYQVRYEVQLMPRQGTASVRIRVSQSEALLRELRLEIDPERHFEFNTAAELRVEAQHVRWPVPARGGELRYTVRIDHTRDPARYDARCTPNWALFRGEDLVPPRRARRRRGARGNFSLLLRTPPDWDTVTSYAPSDDATHAIPPRGRELARPRGWILSGKLYTLHESVEGMAVTVASPRGDVFRGRDLLALLRWTAPELKAIFGALPERLVIVGADDPMWRGGLSGPNSIYLHSDIPLLDPSWTSPLLHELIHVATHARSVAAGDWIVEGLAEYYALELLRRSGTIGDDSYRAALERFQRRGRRVTNLAGQSAGGAVTARAVTVFRDLDLALRDATEGRRSLDDVLRALERDPGAVEPIRFEALVADIAGRDLSDFFRSRVRPHAERPGTNKLGTTTGGNR